ncbi:uncharacterized protein [Porites lutea]|uniref:uncharacterized protein n=1 Tax=Porites lutea TaxID=51062 RepID=UPI003CC55291
MMHTLLHSALLFLLLAVLFSDRQVAGRCSEKGVADTPWAACLVAEEGDVCPHNFKKLEDDFACEPYGSRTPPYKKRVCCLLGPILDLQIKDSPCLAGSPAGDQVEKKDKRLKHH